jgi:membrane fusion protein (multidrug efflux system)
MKMSYLRYLVLGSLVLTLIACGGSQETDNNGDRRQGSGGGMRGGMPGMGGPQQTAAVPVQTKTVTRASISEFLETNGTLEAENEVDLVARASGPVTELVAEEGDMVKTGQLLARIDDREARNQVAIAAVNRDEAKLAFERTKTTFDKGLVSQEAYDSAMSQLQSTEAQLENAKLQLAYTEIRAPFDALVVTRHIKLAQHVSPGNPLFRISDFTPLLCPIEVPEKDLARLRKGQPARIEVEAFKDEVFDAWVLRIRPTIDATTGTLTVTLEVNGRGKLRPGMFASVFLETDTHENAIVIPRTALVLDSIGDTVFVRNGEAASRREVRLGFREETVVEVLEGLDDGEELIVLGQDGLAEGTPISILADQSEQPVQRAAMPGKAGGQEGLSDEQLEMIKARMKERGMSDEQIAERIQQMKEGSGQFGHRGGSPAPQTAQSTEPAATTESERRARPADNQPAQAAAGEHQGRGIGPGRPPGGFSAGSIPPRMEQRIKEASPEDLERIKERIKQFSDMTDEQIDELFKKIRGEETVS